MNYPHPAQTLVESFNALADEVQLLIDRKTILEHKLRFAHEQYQVLADKYATGAPEIASTLAKLQLPQELKHHLPDLSSTVPLPRRSQPGNAQHQIALLIREGRRAAQQLTANAADVNQSTDSRNATSSSSSPTNGMPSEPVGLEQDFTVEGKKGMLACPFSSTADGVVAPHSQEDSVPGGLTGTTADPTPHQSSDPICAAMLEEATSAPVQGPSKCPIRYLDKHSPEEIARYVETHKHEIPRSHEVCVARYQKSEEQIRKLDAKYGNLVSMIEDLSHLHRPMLPAAGGGAEEVDRMSNTRVASWAYEVSPSDPDELKAVSGTLEDEQEGSLKSLGTLGDEQEGPLKSLGDVRLGESPTTPAGMHVPTDFIRKFEGADLGLSSPKVKGPLNSYSSHHIDVDRYGSKGCPFRRAKSPLRSTLPKRDELTSEDHLPREGRRILPEGGQEPSFTPIKSREQREQSQPTFVNLDLNDMSAKKNEAGIPQVVFNISGPVFIGYPMEQAVEFMRQLQKK